MFKMLLYIASRNLIRRLKFLITVVLCVGFTAFSFVLTMSVLDMTVSGIELSQERQGADILVCPNDSEISDTSMLYSGVSQSVYMEKSIIDTFKDENVESITTQFYLHTIPSSSCCVIEEEYRLVGIDWETDFIVRPWIKNPELTSLENGQIIVGAALEDEIGEGTFILNNALEVVSVLEPTGTSLDYSVFFNIDQLRRIGKVNFLPELFDNKETTEMITCAMIKLKEGVSAEKYISQFGDVNAKIISISSVEKNLQGTIDTFAKIFTALIGIILLLCCVTLLSQFRMLTISRCKEVGYLRSIGMSQTNIYALFIMEFGFVGLLGGLVGSILGVVSAVPVIEWICQRVSLPLAYWNGSFMIKHMLAGIGMSLLICLFSTISPLRYITHISPHDAITKGEI